MLVVTGRYYKCSLRRLPWPRRHWPVPVFPSVMGIRKSLLLDASLLASTYITNIYIFESVAYKIKSQICLINLNFYIMFLGVCTYDNLKKSSGCYLYPGSNPSLFCFVSEGTIQVSVLVLVSILPEADTKRGLSVARIFLGEVPV